MDPVFTPIREQARRISPYVLVMVQNYIADLEKAMNRRSIDHGVDESFKKFVDSRGDSYESERDIANIGTRNRNQSARELHALKVLHRDLRDYYGERANGARPYEVVFSNTGSFRSSTLSELNRRHSAMRLQSPPAKSKFLADVH